MIVGKEMLTGYQALAFICWRTEKAMQIFADEDEAEELWTDALLGIYPEELGEPLMWPPEAQLRLTLALENGELSYYRRAGAA